MPSKDLEKPPATLGVGVHGPMREQSWAEQRLEQRASSPVKPGRKSRVSPRVNMTPAQRAHNLSEKHLAMLAENRRKMAERGDRPTTKGVLQGWAGKRGRRLLKEARARAQEKVTIIMDHLVKNGVLDKDAAGNEALRFGMEVVLAKSDKGEPVYSVADRLKAAKMVADFTVAKPETKTKVTVEKAEDWLEGIAAQETAKE